MTEINSPLSLSDPLKQLIHKLHVHGLAELGPLGAVGRSMKENLMMEAADRLLALDAQLKATSEERDGLKLENIHQQKRAEALEAEKAQLQEKLDNAWKVYKANIESLEKEFAERSFPQGTAPKEPT